MEAAIAVENWARFKKPAISAAMLSKTIEGRAGDLLRKTIESFNELALLLHHEWADAWPKSSKKVLEAQQDSGLHALREIEKAISRLIVLYDHKRMEHYGVEQEIKSLRAPAEKRKMFEASIPSTSQVDAGAEMHPDLSQQVDEREDVPFFDDDNLIKEELVAEVKEEPLDEPMIDAFCPETGASRQISAADFDSRRADDVPQAVNIPGPIKQPAVVRRRYNARVLDKDALQRAIQCNQEAAARIVPFDSVASGAPQCRRCYLCDHRVFKYYVVPPQHGLRVAFLNRIVKFDGDERMRINVLKAEWTQAFICTNHITRATPTAAAVHEDDGGNGLEDDARSDLTKSGRPKSKTPRCDMCGSPSLGLTISPKEPGAALRFFRDMINITLSQRRKLQYFLQHKRQWNICRRHLKQAVPNTNRLIARPPPNQRMISNELQEISAKCDLLMRTVQQHTSEGEEAVVNDEQTP